ncbi:hypothetical protein B0H14DRAFT_3657558 [Mycena olivaceomarginata]|nr:hypothetical protein B0H14DRAFT_3657558 [Mycena olivaceomarginata]
MDLNGIPPPYSMQDLFLATPEEHPPAYRRLPLYEDIVRDVGQLGEAMGVAESPMAQNNDIGLIPERKIGSQAVFAAEIEIYDKEVKVGVEFAGKEARELLRGSLPVPSLPEYSFEGSAPLSSLSISQATASIESSVGSLPLSSLTHSIDPGPRPPGVSVTIHVKHERARSPPRPKAPRLTPTRAPRITLVVDVGVAVHLLFFAPVEVCNHGILGQFLAQLPHLICASQSVPGAVPRTATVYSPASGSLRRSPIVERNTVQLLAAIDMFVPYASRPPRSPYVVYPDPAMPAQQHPAAHTPALSRILVVRVALSRSGTSSYDNIADDESSDSSTTGFSDGCGFPSAERIRVRWAKPMKVIGGGDGRRRVGVKDVKGDMTCEVLGKMWDPQHQQEGIVMSVEGDVQTKGSDISWVPGRLNDWEVGAALVWTLRSKLGAMPSIFAHTAGRSRNTLASTPVAPTIALNTAALDQFRNVGHNDADCIKVYAEPRLVNKIDASLGSTSRSYSPETPMEEIKAELINGWNIAWLRKHDFPLRIEDSELRFHGNQNILENSQYLAVLDFYQAHKSAGNHEAYFTKMPKHAAAMKGKVLALELWMESSDETA